MKVLQEQYNLIKEGKGNKAHFLKTAFRLFPDMLSPVNTYEDTVHILKNRSIISEGIGGVVTTGKTPDWHQIFKENITEAAKAEEKEATKEVTDMETAGYDYKDKKNYDNVFGEEFLKGFYTEMGDSKNEGKTVEELRQIVAKNLSKDMSYYVKDGQFGLKGVGYETELPGLGTPKEAKGKFKSSGYGDLKESKHSDEADLKIYKSELKMLNKIKPTGEKQLKRKEELEEKIANLEKKMDKSYSSLKESVLRAFISEMVKEALKPEDEEMFSKATDVAEKLYDKLGNIKAVLAKIPAEYASFKDELEQHLIQKYEG
jgi:hypothetical protein